MADSLSTRVVLAVAERRGVEPTTLPSLHDVLDPGALDDLFDPRANGAGRNGSSYDLQFSYAGCDVHVHDGDVTVRECSRKPDDPIGP